jgi:protein transport protein SEC61 subunit gamma-like protein
MMQKLKTFYEECARVITVTKKPNKTEFWTISKVAAIGILLLGILGFLIFIVKQVIVTWGAL